MVDVYDNKDEFLAMGHYAEGSIAVRILTFTQEEPDDRFWYNKIKAAYDYRVAMDIIGSDDTNTYRLVHAEGDGMPGLIVDFYNGTAIVQMHSMGMYLEKENICDALREVYGDMLEAIYEKSENTLHAKNGVEPKNGFIYGESKTDVALEHGNKFKIDWLKGQKTGFFVDQRENRKLLGELSKGRKVLNMFCYTGGFSVYAMRGGAELVHSVDASARAIDLTDENIALNFEDTSRHASFAMDAFEYLKDVKDKYDLIVLDPPAFAKHQRVLHNALQGYKRLNIAALQQIKSGGILFTYSCSQVVSNENFRKMLFAAAANTGRNVRILYQMSQPIDHPVSIYHPEGEYLKGLVVYVD